MAATPPISQARTRAWLSVTGRVTWRPSESVQTVTGLPAALPAGTRTWPECGEPSAAVHTTSAHTCSARDTSWFRDAVPGARSASRATRGRHSTRSRASPSSTDRLTAVPASIPAHTASSPTPSTTQASTLSARRLSGLRRQRHSHTFGPRNAIEGTLLTSA